MTHEPPDSGDDRLREAQATIERQADEIARLQDQLGAADLVRELRTALALASIAETIAAPADFSHTRLLELIVETAAAVIGARSASLFLIDEATQELVFAVALGPEAPTVKELRVPLGHGIAGLVAVSGQPIAVSDADADPRQAADVARQIGYTPKAILCVPLLYEDHIIGVIELLDRLDGAAFSARDMTTLGLFANQAAIAIIQSRTRASGVALVRDLIVSFNPASPDETPLHERLEAFLSARAGSDGAEYQQALALATLVQEIVWHGDRESEACRAILQSFAGYLRGRAQPFGEVGLMQ
jgi:putative methionine-R-sulfoxide reductase with GAF domain